MNLFFQISWDQHASHQILERWVDRALLDEQVSGICMSSMGEDGQVLNLTSKRALMDLRKQFVSERVNEIDMQFGRTLGCRMSRLLGQYVDQSNHEKRSQQGFRRVRGKWRINLYPKKQGDEEDEEEMKEEDETMKDVE
jgi:hypothetical protein